MSKHAGTAPLPLALIGLLIPVGTGAICGAFTGLTITRAYLPPFIATQG